MNIKVQFFAQLGQAAGTGSVSIEVDEPCTAQELVTRLVNDYGEAFQELVLDGSAALRSTVLLFVSGTQIRWDTPVELRDMDDLLLLSPIAGG